MQVAGVHVDLSMYVGSWRVKRHSTQSWTIWLQSNFSNCGHSSTWHKIPQPKK